MISIDSGGNYRGYIGDLSRMGILGEPDSELRELLHEVEDIQQAARRVIRPGAMGGDIIAAGEAMVKSSPNRAVLDFTAHGHRAGQPRGAAADRDRSGPLHAI